MKITTIILAASCIVEFTLALRSASNGELSEQNLAVRNAHPRLLLSKRAKKLKSAFKQNAKSSRHSVNIVDGKNALKSH